MLILITTLMLAPSPNRLVNPDFHQGASGWITRGSVSIEGGPQPTVRLQPGASLTQRYEVPGLRILYVAAQIEGNKSGLCPIFSGKLSLSATGLMVIPPPLERFFRVLLRASRAG